MGPDVSEITRTPMQRTSLGRGDQWGRSGRSGRSPKVGRGRGQSDEEEGDKKLLGLTPRWAGNAAHRVMLPSQQEKEMQAAGQDKATQRSDDTG